jgi:hypothetical protein
MPLTRFVGVTANIPMTSDKKGGTAMFAVHCHGHHRRVLLDWSCVEGLRTIDDGPVLDWRCWCGVRGCLIGGVRSAPRPAVELEPLAGR